MSGDAFLEDFRALSRIGATPGGGVDRQAATEEDAQTREWLTEWLTRRGFEVRIDGIGNLFGLLEIAPGSPYLLVGSHLDSQPLAGRFDGAYGVLAAAHAVHRLAQGGTAEAARFNLAVVDWFNEEGSRFKPSMMGSAVFTGALSASIALDTEDVAGISVRDALSAIGQLGEATPPEVAVYAEIHVEQGRGLERSGTTIGLVSSTWSAYKYTIRVLGEQAHTGSTPMDERRDALLAASALVVAINDLTRRFDAGVLHTSVGELHVLPNSPVVVAREVRLLADLRSSESAHLGVAYGLLLERIAEIDERYGTTTEVLSSSVWQSAPFAEQGIETAARAAEAVGHTATRVLTLAGHDATNMKEVTPTVMLFVPSVEGISHNERELTSDDDLIAGLDVLTELLRRIQAGEFG